MSFSKRDVRILLISDVTMLRVVSYSNSMFYSNSLKIHHMLFQCRESNERKTIRTSDLIISCLGYPVVYSGPFRNKNGGRLRQNFSSISSASRFLSYVNTMY
jgi:hypothetical protein